MRKAIKTNRVDVETLKHPVRRSLREWRSVDAVRK